MIVIGIAGIASALLALQLKNVKEEYAILITLCGCLFILFSTLKGIQSIVTILEQITALSTIGKGYIKILLKLTGIAFVAEISSDISGDCGFEALAKQIQIFGKISILVVSLPVFTEIILSIGKLLS